MDELELVFPTKEYKEKILDFKKEFNGETIHGCGGLGRIEDIDEWLFKIKEDLTKDTPTRVRATLFIAVRKSDQKIVGIIQIRHRLNEHLLLYGGHIGDSVRPSERKKGYATEMIRLALNECKNLGIFKVLMVCYVDNIGSEKSIINNGGVLENIVEDEDGNKIKRFWIDLK